MRKFLKESGLTDRGSTEIAQVIETNDSEFCCYWAQSPKVELRREEHWYRLISDIDHPYFNSIFEAQLPTTGIVSAIEEAIRPYRDRGRQMSWWIGPASRPITLGQHLEQLEFKKTACEAAMAICPFEADFERISDDVEIQAVTSATQLRTWVEIMTGVYGLPEFTREPWFQILNRLGLDGRSKLQHFVARLDGDVAGVGSVFYGSQAAGIYNIAVLPEFRGQGVASTLTISLLSLIDEQGYQLATLCASQEAEKLYRKIGFQMHGELNCFVWSPA
ncbi:GNAT family N-acetyltransferase [Bremerella sp. T1]|uniref:GNAT family N-acetyltransferase n=1 Tax=Bremerella sp. TYQ1 TaxID=3119568 RepID=UPI001CCCA7F0|nr:GNAT family N-acetyltransferase [Bremerella volcania]UBM35620.1 GNAT family N-acetyltransferase [Bremerella volcania]